MHHQSCPRLGSCFFLVRSRPRSCLRFFFFNDTATTEIYTLSLHDALPIYVPSPLPSRIDTVPAEKLVAATSSLPSPLKSALATAIGDGKLDVAATNFSAGTVSKIGRAHV